MQRNIGKCCRYSIFSTFTGFAVCSNQVLCFVVVSNLVCYHYRLLRLFSTIAVCLKVKLFCRCRANVVLLAILFVILAVLITVANITVILVYSTEKKSRHSQGIFRLSLGVADLIVGLFVFPSAVAIGVKGFQHDINLLPPVIVNGLERVGTGNSTGVNSSVAVQMVESREMVFNQIFPIEFLNFVGFFSTVSLTVSIYLLTVSGVDRLLAISRPVHYRQHQAKNFATISSIIAWLFAIIVGLLPVFIEGLQYNITGTGIVTLLGRISLILYAVGFFVPLIATWIIAIAMFIYSKRSFKVRATMSTIRHQQVNKQRRLNRILSLMVTAFSVSIVPTVLVLILIIFIPGTNQTLVDSYNPVFNNIANSLESVAIIILLCNSLWNCLIYSLRTKTFRRTAAQKYRSIWDAINPAKWFSRLTCCREICEKSPRFHKRNFSKSVTTSSARTTNTTNASSVESLKYLKKCKTPKGNHLDRVSTNSGTNETSNLSPTASNQKSFTYKPEQVDSKV